MSFFDEADAPVQEPPPEPEYRPAEWRGAPENWLPVGVALNAVLVRTDQLALTITDARVYPTGLLFGLALVRRAREERRGRHQPPFLSHGPREEGDPRFGVAYADGRKAFADGIWSGAPEAPDIVLSQGGGGGSDRRWEGRFWLWPLPPEGPVTFGLAWSEEGIAETTVEVDSAPIREAAGRAVELWPDDRPLPPPRGEGRGRSWTDYA
jgi:hypothetical protein